MIVFPDSPTIPAKRCPVCGGPVTGMKRSSNPRQANEVQPCGHVAAWQDIAHLPTYPRLVEHLLGNVDAVLAELREASWVDGTGPTRAGEATAQAEAVEHLVAARAALAASVPPARPGSAR